MTLDIPVHPFAARFPLLPEEDLAALAADIQQHGLLNPIVRDATGQIIDGRNRLLACARVGVMPQYTLLAEEQDPVTFILGQNIHRRHMAAGARAMAAALASTFLKKVDGYKLPKGAKSQRVAAIDQAGTTQSYVSMAATVIEYAPHLIDQVLGNGSLTEAYNKHAKPAKDRADAEQAQHQRLAQDHPELDAAVAAGSMTLAEALAAAAAIDRTIAEAAAREALVRTIQLTREEIGPAVPLPPAPDLTVRWEEDQPAWRDPTPGVETQELEDVQVFMRKLSRLQQEIDALSREAVLHDVDFMPGWTLNAVREWASQVVAATYTIVSAYEAAHTGQPPIRKVK